MQSQDSLSVPPAAAEAYAVPMSQHLHSWQQLKCNSRGSAADASSEALQGNQPCNLRRQLL